MVDAYVAPKIHGLPAALQRRRQVGQGHFRVIFHVIGKIRNPALQGRAGFGRDKQQLMPIYATAVPGKVLLEQDVRVGATKSEGGHGGAFWPLLHRPAHGSLGNEERAVF